MKNLNSFKAIARAIEGERERQTELLEEGKSVIQETRRWDDNKEYSYAMRSKGGCPGLPLFSRSGSASRFYQR